MQNVILVKRSNEKLVGNMQLTLLEAKKCKFQQKFFGIPNKEISIIPVSIHGLILAYLSSTFL